METVAFLQALVRALGAGWAVRYGVIAPYGVYGLRLTSDAGGAIEVVPSLVRGDAVVWSPFVFARGALHYDLHIDGALLRTPVLDEAVARLAQWRRDRGPAAQMAARFERTAGSRKARTTEVDERMRGVDGERAGGTPGGDALAVPGESLADALRDKKLGETERARKLAKLRDRDQAIRELLAIVKRARGDARANALDVLVGVARPEEGPEVARYLDDPERSVQRAAVDGVVRIGYAAAVPALAALVVARDARPGRGRQQLAVSAATAMKALSGKRGAAALTGYLTSTDARVREAACVALAMAGRPVARQARPLVEGLLGDRDAHVVRAAKRALAAR